MAAHMETPIRYMHKIKKQLNTNPESTYTTKNGNKNLPQYLWKHANVLTK